MSRESWLNGWWRNGTWVLMGTGVHCAGCGKFRGITCIAIGDDYKEPEKAPDWPFEEKSCPVCLLIEQLSDDSEPQLNMRAGPKGKLP